MKKVFIENGSSDYKAMFREYGFESTYNWKEADLVCFTGGEDVTPALYGHSKHPTTFCNPDRDLMCMHLYRSCLELNIPVVGICRGGQFLNVVNGGTMYQDVRGHTRPHALFATLYGVELAVREASSTHHQMMIPAKDGELAGWGEDGTCTKTIRWDVKDGSWETKEGEGLPNNEIIFYKKTRSLCFQPHPEFRGYEELRALFFRMVEGLLGV